MQAVLAELWVLCGEIVLRASLPGFPLPQERRNRSITCGIERDALRETRMYGLSQRNQDKASLRHARGGGQPDKLR